MVNIDPIKAAIAVALLVVLALAGWRIHAFGEARYQAGRDKVQADWNASIERGRREVELLRAAAGKVTVRTEIQ